MSARAWKPGDVAMLKINTRQGRWQRGVRVRPCEQHSYYVWQVDGGGLSEDAVDEARPLVVIDPEDRTQLRQVEAQMSRLCGWRLLSSEQRVDALADALRSHTAEPKPEEPTGLGAVVEDADGNCWIRHGNGPAAWMLAGASPGNRDTYSYTDIPAVKVLAEGVTK